MSVIPKELIVFLVSALPIGELRAGIPLGLGFDLSPWLVFWLAVLGNLAPVIPILLFLEPASKWLMSQSKFFDRTLGGLFERTRQKHSERIDKYGALGLILFVAIPSPGTGAWTGCLAAWLFDVKLRYAIPAVVTGVFIAGFIVMGVVTGAVAAFKFLENPFISIGLFVLIVVAAWAIFRSRGKGKESEEAPS